MVLPFDSLTYLVHSATFDTDGAALWVLKGVSGAGGVDEHWCCDGYDVTRVAWGAVPEVWAIASTNCRELDPCVDFGHCGQAAQPPEERACGCATPGSMAVGALVALVAAAGLRRRR